MSQPLLTESPDKTHRRIARREPHPASTRSFQGLNPILQLQRTLGNQRVAQLIKAERLTPDGKIIGLQPKLTVGAADDQYEQEADRIARQVVNMPDSVATAFFQQAPQVEGEAEKAQNQTQALQSKPLPLAASITPFVQRQWGREAVVEANGEEMRIQAKFLTETYGVPMQRQSATGEEENESIQTKSGVSLSDSFEAGDDVESRLSQSKGGGSPLPDPVRTYMEPRFGVDFSHVRVHTGSIAIQMNRDVGAQAFTHGSDIFFGAGSSPSDLELTAHELTHVVQQNGYQLQRAQTQAEKGAAERGTPPEPKKIYFHAPFISVQRQDYPPDHLGRLNEMLDRINVPENEVISLLRQLTPAEKATVTTYPSYKSKMASAFDTGEMVQAVGILNLSLNKKLEWVEAAATSTSSIDYSEIRTLITSAPQADRDALKTTKWRDFFVGVCDNSTIITAVTDLHFNLLTQLEWIEKEETSPENLEYSQIRSLITTAPQADRDVLKKTKWRDFFVGICDNSTIITAVTDLQFNLLTQLEWIEEEASPENLEYSQIRSLITTAPQADRDVLKKTKWRDFFVGICDNSTIITAVTDLQFNLLTQLEWIEEASPKSLEYSQIQSLITTPTQADRDALKTNRWRDFFVGVCTNTTIKNALDDLSFDLLTTIQWLLQEASPSNVDFTWLCNRFKSVNAFPPGEEVIACTIMERDIREGNFDTSADHTPAGWITRAHKQLLVANEMGGLVGQTATWRGSGPGSGTTFEAWASAPVEGPIPTLSAITVINCWEMVMLAAFRSGVLSWPRIHAIYTSSAPDWNAFLVNELSFSNRIPYNPASPAVRPVAGDIVFFDGASHIALAVGSVDALGRTQIYSFWPPPNTLFTAGGTIDQVKITTTEELNDYWVGDGHAAFHIEFATPNW